MFNLVQMLRSRAEQNPDDPAYLFLIDGEQEGPRLSFGQLDEQARSVAAALQERADVQQRAILLYPPGLDFLAAFFGCLYAGVTAVPLYPPRPAFLRPGTQPTTCASSESRLISGGRSI